MASLRERLARKPPGYRFTIGRILAIYSGLMVTLLLAGIVAYVVNDTGVAAAGFEFGLGIVGLPNLR